MKLLIKETFINNYNNLLESSPKGDIAAFETEDNSRCSGDNVTVFVHQTTANLLLDSEVRLQEQIENVKKLQKKKTALTMKENDEKVKKKILAEIKELEAAKLGSSVQLIEMDQTSK